MKNLLSCFLLRVAARAAGAAPSAVSSDVQIYALRGQAAIDLLRSDRQLPEYCLRCPNDPSWPGATLRDPRMVACPFN